MTRRRTACEAAPSRPPPSSGAQANPTPRHPPHGAPATKRLAPALALLLLFACDFDAAYDAWCAGDPACAGAGGSAGAGGAAGAGGTAGAGGSAGEGGVSGAGGAFAIDLQPLRACADARACAPAELCHPHGHVCMRACAEDADCPAEEPHCAALAPGATARACTCATTASCTDVVPGSACNPLDDRCEMPCASSADCTSFEPVRACNETSALCVETDAVCETNADCSTAARPRCDPGTHRCTRCRSHADCAGRTDGATLCIPSGACVPHA